MFFAKFANLPDFSGPPPPPRGGLENPRQIFGLTPLKNGFFENSKNHIFKEGDYNHNVVQCTIKTGFILR